jgi:hypothetical protein
MNYDRVSNTIPEIDEDIEELQATVVIVPPREIDCKHKVLYTCLGVVLTAKMLVVCWIFMQSFPTDALSHLLNW